MTHSRGLEFGTIGDLGIGGATSTRRTIDTRLSSLALRFANEMREENNPTDSAILGHHTQTRVPLWSCVATSNLTGQTIDVARAITEYTTRSFSGARGSIRTGCISSTPNQLDAAILADTKASPNRNYTRHYTYDHTAITPDGRFIGYQVYTIKRPTGGITNSPSQIHSQWVSNMYDITNGHSSSAVVDEFERLLENSRAHYRQRHNPTDRQAQQKYQPQAINSPKATPPKSAIQAFFSY